MAPIAAGRIVETKESELNALGGTGVGHGYRVFHPSVVDCG
jgi:hypothetical protein